MKWDGARAVAYRDGDSVRLTGRHDTDYTARFPEVAEALAKVASPLVLDGEIVVMRDGVPSFTALQTRIHRTRPASVRAAATSTPALFVAFDVLHDARPLLAEPYRRRRTILENLDLDHPRLRVPPAWTSVPDAYGWTKEYRLEGVIAKRSDSPYRPGARSRDWVKIKHLKTADVVIGGDARFEAGLAWARVWAKEHGGSLACPARASIGSYPIGTWLSELRAAAQVPVDQPGALASERRAALEEIDPWWCPAWPITWQRAYATARQWWLESDGRVDWAQLPADVVFEGEQLGRWVRAQRADWPGLEASQRDLLAAIGIEEDQELVAAKAAAEAKLKAPRADRFQQGLAALAAFVEREGHAKVPRPHKEPLEIVVTGPGGEESVEVVSVGLGAFLNNTKARRAKLSPGQLAQLAEHGVEWA
ncbi:Helicase associated domain protein [Kitasatospora sp. NPDC087314]|uniref:ATP-dependent DNA ligase n=1 Tax=Kitasatospora sp. NPDC087314 TaxID=3364068 RepID=UPI0037F8818F